MKGQSLTKLQNGLTYAGMVLPHVFIHFNFQIFQIMYVLFLPLLFGLPFALMQRKWNLVSAIGSHALVDVIRFCVFGV